MGWSLKSLPLAKIPAGRARDLVIAIHNLQTKALHNP